MTDEQTTMRQPSHLLVTKRHSKSRGSKIESGRPKVEQLITRAGNRGVRVSDFSLKKLCFSDLCGSN